MFGYLRNLTVTAWGVFSAANVMLLALMKVVPGYVGLLFLGTALLAECVLLVRYSRILAQWRVPLLCWAIFLGSRLMITWPQIWGASSGDQVTNAASILAVETLIVGYATVIALAVRRDVSVAYINLVLIGGAIAFYLSAQSAGSVLNLFVDQSREATLASSLWGSLIVGLSCMGAVGVLTFLPHLLWLIFRELRGNSRGSTSQRILLIEKGWPVWSLQIMAGLAHRATVSQAHLPQIPEGLRDDVLRRYNADNARHYDLELRSGALHLGPEALAAKEALSAWYCALSMRETKPQYLSTVMPDLLECSGAVLGTELAVLEASDDWYGCLLDISHVFSDARLPQKLPLIFGRYTAITSEHLEKLHPYLQQHGIDSAVVLLGMFYGPAELENAREWRTRMRLVYGYDAILLDYPELFGLLVSKNRKDVLRSQIISHSKRSDISPFKITGPATDEVFVGREPEIRRLTQRVGTAPCAVVGGRLIGKTSILRRLHRRHLPAAGFRSASLDCSPASTVDALLEFPILEWSPEPPSPAPANLRELLQSLPVDKPTVLLLDEADRLITIDRSSGWPILSTLRSLAQSDRIHVVLSGERVLRDALRDATSPLFNFASEVVLLGALSQEAVRELVSRPMKQLEIKLINEADLVREIYAFTGGHPNVVQRVCQRLLERLDQLDSSQIIVEDVRAISDDRKCMGSDLLGTYWGGASPLEKIITLLLAQDVKLYDFADVQQQLFERAHLQLTETAVKDALDRLVDLRCILDRCRPDAYSFRVKSFPMALGKTTTYEEQLSELIRQYDQLGD